MIIKKEEIILTDKDRSDIGKELLMIFSNYAADFGRDPESSQEAKYTIEKVQKVFESEDGFYKVFYKIMNPVTRHSEYCWTNYETKYLSPSLIFNKKNDLVNRYKSLSLWKEVLEKLLSECSDGISNLEDLLKIEGYIEETNIGKTFNELGEIILEDD